MSKDLRSQSGTSFGQVPKFPSKWEHVHVWRHVRSLVGRARLPHVPFALLRVHVSYVCTIRRTYKWFTDESGTIWLKLNPLSPCPESACGERVRDTAIIHVFVG